MRRISLWLLSTISALVLLFSYQSSVTQAAGTSIVADGGADTATSSPTTSPGDSSRSGSSRSGSSTDSNTSSSSTSGSGSSTAATTYTGEAVSTRYGNVQVRITVSGGRVTTSEVTQVPWSSGHDRQINAQAVPILNQEAVDAQSASIDMVSGATYTSEGYIQSLQSAIDQAHL